MLQVQALQRSAASGKLIIITGAGTSLALAEPTDPAKNWKQLIGSGLQTAKVKQKITDIQFDRWNETLQSNDMDDLLATAEFVSAKLGGPGGILYSRWLADTFENMKVKLGSERDTFHKIAQRGVPICTLNYDTLLERAGRPDDRAALQHRSRAAGSLARDEAAHREAPRQLSLDHPLYHHGRGFSHLSARVRALRQHGAADHDGEHYGLARFLR